MTCLRDLIRCGLACGIAVVVLCSLGPAVATAQSVRGFGEVPNGGGLSPSEISVDAWVDDNGVAQGTVTWVGDVFFDTPAGPADPWLIEVYDLVFFGNTAVVSGVVVHSVFPSDIGSGVQFFFTDNSGTGQPDEIDGSPIVAGNIVVTD